MYTPSFASNQVLFAVLAVWELVWKGLALWKASKADHKFWFVLLLILNTVGVFPIIYLLVLKFAKKTVEEPKLEIK